MIVMPHLSTSDCPEHLRITYGFLHSKPPDINCPFERHSKRNSRIIEYQEEGMGLAEIAEVMGLTKSTVVGVIERWGI